MLLAWKKKIHSSKCTPKRACDECCQRKEKCQCVAKKYCTRCADWIGKKCVDCEELPPKCTSNGKKKPFILIQKLRLKVFSGCCARQLLSTQPDFEAQRCAIEEMIASSGDFPHLTLYYPKFHCELNHIERFWCHVKQKAREICDYILEGLRKHVPMALASVFNSTILGNYNSCLRKMELYRQGIGYGNTE